MRKKILLVDDVDFSLQLEKEVFNMVDKEYSLGLHIDTASNLKDALALVSQHTYDLIITDMNLPDGNGVQVAQLAEKKSMQYTKIVALTIYPHAYEADRPYFDDFMSKPIEPVCFKEKVMILLNS